MPYPPKEYIFKTLTHHKHRLGDTTTLFPEHNPTPSPDTEYWYYSDLYNLFGAPEFSITNLHEHAWQSIRSIPNNTAPLHDHVELCHHEYNICESTPPYKIIPTFGADAKLTRYACWAIFKQYPNLIFTQMFFMTPDTDFKTLYRESYKFARIYQRKKLRHSERVLSGVLTDLNANIRLTQHEMSRTFFGGLTNDDIRTQFQIPQTPHKPLADYMGVYSLFARRTAIDTAIRKFAYVRQPNLHSFNLILHDELLSARNHMLREYKISPNMDIHHTPINTVESEYKKHERAFISKYAHEKIR